MGILMLAVAFVAVVLALMVPPGDGDGSQGQQGGQAGAGAAGDGAPPAGGAGAGAGAGAGGAATGEGSQQQTSTPGSQAGAAFSIQLTDAQRKALLDGKPLELAEEQYTAGVRSQMEAERRKRVAAEKQLAKIAEDREAAERKSLEEQEKFKDLYEREKTAHATTAAQRQADLIRSDFMLAAAKANVIDPWAAYQLIRAMPSFEGIKVGEDGAITGIDEAIKSLVEEKPYLVSQQQTGQPRQTSVGSASNPGSTTPVAPKTLAEAGNELERRLAGGLG